MADRVPFSEVACTKGGGRGLLGLLEVEWARFRHEAAVIDPLAAMDIVGRVGSSMCGVVQYELRRLRNIHKGEDE